MNTEREERGRKTCSAKIQWFDLLPDILQEKCYLEESLIEANSLLKKTEILEPCEYLLDFLWQMPV